jgi:AcrR family transcriptional regulator
MFSKFLNLDKEKQDRVLNAAIKEFALKGYKNASTNEIVKEADISKGLLFHYFKNKKELFLFLYDYCIETVTSDLYKKIDMSESDIILRLRQMALTKLELLSKYPEIMKFLQVAYMEDAVEVRNEIEERNSRIIKDNYGGAFENIDITKFKEGIDIEKVINIIVWTFDGFGNAELTKAKLAPNKEIDYKKMFEEADTYMELFKNCFYK